VAISRSGAASLTEISHYALPSVLIPFPQAADDHQLANAREFERTGSSIVWEQGNLLPEVFASAFRKLLQNDRLLLDMSHSARGMEIANAAGYVANEVEQCVRN
jgi:UDP-N-acetylglucosamine--N-acetylmuramyl-(pentapeptide) pyrophosphoryl-undecaprenol N-acetylglucosamine transferase